jgi:hypothetical protein
VIRSNFGEANIVRGVDFSIGENRLLTIFSRPRRNYGGKKRGFARGA